MKILNSRDLSSILVREKQCKFGDSCRFYANSSYTCTHLGGEYCGKYRAMMQTGKKGIDGKSLREENPILA